ncbi:MAG: AEC family transporter [Casimicrobium sp.]
MLDILSITTPIYLIILIGYAMTRRGLFAKADMRVLGTFVMNLALPALLFKALSTRPIVEIFNMPYLLAYGFGSLLAIAVGYAWSRRVSGQDVTTSAISAMGMSCSNSGFVGYPILLLTMPSVAGVALALNMLIENLIAIPLLLFIAEQGRNPAGRWRAVRDSMLRLTRNPLVIGLTAGVLFSLTGWALPTPIARTVDLLAAASGAVSLFIIGGTLVGVELRGLARRTAPIVVGKLLLHPLFVFALVAAFAAMGLHIVDAELRAAAVLLAAMPMMGVYTTIAQGFGKAESSAAALLVTTIASFFTLSAVLWMLRHGAFV